MPWVAGFQQRDRCASPPWPRCPTTPWSAALARLYRHLPAETDEAQRSSLTLDARAAARNASTAAIEDLVVDRGRAVGPDAATQRYKVDAVRRDDAQGRPQRPVPVRQRQQVQAAATAR